MSYVSHESLPYLVKKLTDPSNIKITGNANGTRVGTVVDKLIEKADNITRALDQEVVNDGYSFKIGTGDVDVGSSVEDSFGEIGVKGRTYQNMLPPIVKENFSSLSSGIVLANNKITIPANGEFRNFFIKVDNTLLKPSTIYTVVLYITKNTLQPFNESTIAISSNHATEAILGINRIASNSVGVIPIKVTTKNSFDGITYGIRSFVSGSATEGEIELSYIILEGDHTNNPNLPSYFEGVVGVGDKSKNLFNPTWEFGNISTSTGLDSPSIINKRTGFIELDGVCTFSRKNPSDAMGFRFYDKDKNFLASRTSNIGDKIRILDIPNTSYIRIVSIDGIEDNEYQIEKGNVATEYQPYGTHKIEILSSGAEMCDYNKMEGNSKNIYWLYNAKENTEYFVKYFNAKSEGGHITVRWYDSNMNQISSRTLYANNHKFTTPAETKSFKVDFNHGWNPSTDYEQFSKVRLSIREGGFAESYTPHQSDKTQILLDAPLMRLPNGVADEITFGGKLIRRVGKTIINGKQWMGPYTSDSESGYTSALVQIVGKKYHRDNIDNVISPSFKSVLNRGDVGEYIHSDGWNINTIFKLSNSKLETQDVAGVKKWFEQSPTEVYYELETPIITELPTPNVRLFKDGHLTFNTLVAPTSTHKVLLNKSAQIEQSVREVQSLDSRVGNLESFYDDMMLETSHRLSLLGLDFEYAREMKEESEDI